MANVTNSPALATLVATLRAHLAKMTPDGFCLSHGTVSGNVTAIEDVHGRTLFVVPMRESARLVEADNANAEGIVAILNALPQLLDALGRGHENKELTQDQLDFVDRVRIATGYSTIAAKTFAGLVEIIDQLRVERGHGERGTDTEYRMLVERIEVYADKLEAITREPAGRGGSLRGEVFASLAHQVGKELRALLVAGERGT